jgi:hypothetical protein
MNREGELRKAKAPPGGYFMSLVNKVNVNKPPESASTAAAES